MSGLSGRKIKFIALALGVICAIMFAALAYAGFADGSAVSGICFAVLSLVSLIAIYPGYIIGKLVDDVNALDESSRMQNERLFRIQKESEKQNPTDRYSPANRLKINRNTTGTLSADLTETAKTRIMNMPQPTPPPSRQSGEIPSPVAKDFTREIPIPAEKDIAQETAAKMSSEKKSAPENEKKPAPDKFFTSTAIDISRSAPASKHLQSISAGGLHSVCVRRDGTCVASGYGTYGQCNVSDWAGIIAISAGYNYTVGLRADGTIVAVGANTDGQWGGIRWGSICAVASGGLHTLGLKSDGSCVAVGNNANDQCEVSRWQNVKAVAAGNYHSVGLLANGKVVAVGYNGYGQCNVSEWQDVVAIAAGRNHTIGLTRLGKLLSTGDNTYGQCDVKNFSNIKVNKQ